MLFLMIFLIELCSVRRICRSNIKMLSYYYFADQNNNSLSFLLFLGILTLSFRILLLTIISSLYNSCNPFLTQLCTLLLWLMPLSHLALSFPLMRRKPYTNRSRCPPLPVTRLGQCRRCRLCSKFLALNLPGSRTSR